jgi:hypothetical protein
MESVPGFQFVTASYVSISFTRSKALERHHFLIEAFSNELAPRHELYFRA